MNLKNFYLVSILTVSLACLTSCDGDSEDISDVNIDAYRDMIIIDTHNHDAAGHRYLKSEEMWDAFGIDKVVLFGEISEPSAMGTDEIAFNAYMDNNDLFIPFIAGVNIHDNSSFTYIRERFDAGVFGIGEVVAASTHSPVASKLAWKGRHPMDALFPEIYEICAEYHKPILLHIDPPNGFVIEKLEEAASLYPDVNFIFGHANAFNTPKELRRLLMSHSNIYMDFYAGFTAYDQNSRYTLDDYVPVINEFPNRFFVSSDSGFGINYYDAYRAIYTLFDMLDRPTAEKVAGLNFLRLMDEANAVSAIQATTLKVQ